MQNEDAKKKTYDKAREMAAVMLSRVADNIVKPHKKPLVVHTLVIVSIWKAADDATVYGAVERGKERASAGGSGTLSKVLFGSLRLLGFGYIEATGNGGVEVQKQEGADDVYIITTTIEVRVESTEALALTVASLGEKAKKLPVGVLAALVGVQAGKASLVDFRVDMT